MLVGCCCWKSWSCLLRRKTWSVCSRSLVPRSIWSLLSMLCTELLSARRVVSLLRYTLYNCGTRFWTFFTRGQREGIGDAWLESWCRSIFFFLYCKKLTMVEWKIWKMHPNGFSEVFVWKWRTQRKVYARLTVAVVPFSSLFERWIDAVFARTLLFHQKTFATIE